MQTLSDQVGLDSDVELDSEPGCRAIAAVSDPIRSKAVIKLISALMTANDPKRTSVLVDCCLESLMLCLVKNRSSG